MIQVSATEFKNNVGKFIKLSKKEDILILKNGKAVAKLTAVSKNDKEIAYDRLLEMIKRSKPVSEEIDLEAMREERLKRYDNIT
ncbi:type II toxin-antitoxin system Phd/YefM family antitoxin [Thermosediminibacter oceani]|uniref:Antitoxin n=1 Tax=Thermosediminibacter oceani (strain ATCC BAA-1034 / DSM 16646 / JW/IW-1228P) TaxID=555079 RepID=D9RYE0_THEOJ|nr:type II toxin-antitoxin system Phd/YefM family antitoxin [Thermosediminibacter oceani]ADL08364.1 prevent-host-death family protein [Thermosediminibacter oceani DSM 16646]